MTTPPTILFAGGGTGGHIAPAIAIVERLEQLNCPCRAHFVVSTRPVDGQILAKRGLAYTALPIAPLPLARPWTWPGFAAAWLRSVSVCRGLLRRLNVAAVVATGGFVAPPVVWAAGRANVPVALISLDAVPGKANRYLAARATVLFTVYPDTGWPGATQIGLPLPRAAIGPDDPAGAREQMGLDPQRHTLLITGGSQGAETVNRALIALVGLTPIRKALTGWQVLHLAGPAAADQPVLAELRSAYQQASIPARVETFCNAMGLAWSGASLAVARAGAGTVAEAWANATPTIFLPYPYHRDQHQRRNAEPLVHAGAAVLCRDLIDPDANARQLGGPLSTLLGNSSQRQHMAQRLRETRPDNGAATVARWLRDRACAT